MHHVGETLRAHWSSKGLIVPPGNSEDRIIEFERDYSVKLPPDLRDYFLHVNGMDPHWPNAQDQQGYTFWSLDRVKNVLEEATNHSNGQWWSSFPGADSFFIFADYLDWSWVYTIRLSHDPSRQSPVFLVAKEETPIKIAESFCEFIELYLIDSPKLYGVIE
jgi:SMI1/KNR4 family protein SUKH-1